MINTLSHIIFGQFNALASSILTHNQHFTTKHTSLVLGDRQSTVADMTSHVRTEVTLCLVLTFSDKRQHCRSALYSRSLCVSLQQREICVMIKAKYAALVCGKVFPISDIVIRGGLVGEWIERSLTTREVASSRPGET